MSLEHLEFLKPLKSDYRTLLEKNDDEFDAGFINKYIDTIDPVSKQTFLHFAAELFSASKVMGEVINCLHRPGRENLISMQDISQKTPIHHFAASWYSFDLLQKILKEFPNQGIKALNTPDRNGNLPLHSAIQLCNLSAIIIICQSEQLANMAHFANHDGDTPFDFAVKAADINILKYLYDLKEVRESLSKRNPQQLNALHKAVHKTQPDVAVVSYLLSTPHGQAMIFPTDINGNTPFMLFLQNLHSDISGQKYLADGDKKIIDEFCKLEGLAAMVEIANDTGDTPLCYAIKNNLHYVIESLLKKVDVNQLDKSGKTPLHIAARYAKKDTIELLLTFKANCNKEDSYGQLPLAMANLRDDKEKYLVCNLLRSLTKSNTTKVTEKEIDDPNESCFLPNEILLKIFNELTLSALSKVSQCNKKFYSLANDGKLAAYKNMKQAPSRYIGAFTPFPASCLTYVLISHKEPFYIHPMFNDEYYSSRAEEMCSTFAKEFNRKIQDTTHGYRYVAGLWGIARPYNKFGFLNKEAALSYYEQELSKAPSEPYQLVAYWVPKKYLKSFPKIKHMWSNEGTLAENAYWIAVPRSDSFEFKLGHIQEVTYLNSDKALQRTVVNPFCITNEDALAAFIEKHKINDLAYWSTLSKLGDSVKVVDKKTGKKYNVPFAISYIYDCINNAESTVEEKLLLLNKTWTANEDHNKKKLTVFFNPKTPTRDCVNAAVQLMDWIAQPVTDFSYRM